MIAIGPVSCAVLLLIAAGWTWRMTDCQSARRTATAFASLAVAIAVVCLVAQSMQEPGLGASTLRIAPEGLLGLAPLVTCIAGLTAVALASVADHPPRTLSRILLLFAVALLFLSFDNLVVLFLLWSLSAGIAYTELKSRGDLNGCARLFARYHVPSVLLFGFGALALALGWPGLGVVSMLLAIGVREAVLPAHSWFPRFVEQAPMGIVVAFSATQLGVYAKTRLLAENLSAGAGQSLAAIGAATAVTAAALGLVQVKPRRALAYLVISQTGLVAFGLENRSVVAFSGGLLVLSVLALAVSGFAMTLSALLARRGDLTLETPGGTFARTPRLAVAFLLLGFSTVGFPLTLGFVAEDLLVQGSVAEFPLLGLSLIVATALNGMTVMRAFFTLFSGSDQHEGEMDLVPREKAALSLVMATLLLGGIFPRLVVGLQARSAEGRSITSQPAQYELPERFAPPTQKKAH